jgi:YD repeat-containing protein
MTVNSVAGPGATFTYDAADRLTGITRQVGTSGPQITSTLTYDNADRLTGITHQNGRTTLGL